jgi:hypothetical protein
MPNPHNANHGYDEIPMFNYLPFNIIIKVLVEDVAVQYLDSLAAPLASEVLSIQFYLEMNMKRGASWLWVGYEGWGWACHQHIHQHHDCQQYQIHNKQWIES